MLSKLVVIFLVLFLAFSAPVFGQEWHTTNQITIVWSAVTEMQGGIAIPETDLIEYKVYLSNVATDPGKTNPVEIGVAGDTSYVITLVDEGSYFVGLQTIRSLEDGTFVSESVIGWSDEPFVVREGHIFGIRYFLPPLVPTELHPSN